MPTLSLPAISVVACSLPRVITAQRTRETQHTRVDTISTASTSAAGKQPIPFYTTRLVYVIYDTYIDFQGLVERIDFHKFFNMTFAEPVAAESNAPPRPGNSLELSLIAGQFVFLNNNADSGSTQLKWDAYQFQEQLLARLHIGDKLTITFAPGLLNFNDASSGGTPGPHGTIVPPPAVQGQTFDGTPGSTFGNTLANS